MIKHPNKRRVYKLKDENYAIGQCFYDHEGKPIYANAFEWEDVLEVDAQELEGDFYHEQIFFEDKTLKVDTNWETRLFPVFLIKEKHVANLKKDLEKELAQAKPDIVKALRARSELENAKDSQCTCGKSKKLEEECDCGYDSFWLQQAIKNLDNKVKNGESDKPLIRQKLKAKIKVFAKQKKLEENV